MSFCHVRKVLEEVRTKEYPHKLITTCMKHIFEKLIVTYLVKKFHSFCGTRY